MQPQEESNISQRLVEIIPEQELNSWELEELLACLEDLPPKHQDLLLHQISVIWPVSHSLCLAFLEAVRPALECLEAEQFAAWVRGILDRYESQGLKEARRFMADLDNHFVCTLRGESGLLLSTIKNRLAIYLRGVAGRPFDLESNKQPSTDTTTIFLPRSMTLFANDDANFLVYKLLASLQWAYVRVDLYCQGVPDEEALFAQLPAAPQENKTDIFLKSFFSCFARPHQALAIYHFLRTFQALAFLQKRLPGLMRDSKPYFEKVHQELSTKQPEHGIEAAYHVLLTQLAGNKTLRLPEGDWQECEPTMWARDPRRIFVDTAAIYQQLDIPGPETTLNPPLFAGTLQIDEAHARRLARRQEVAQQFIEALSLRILPTMAKKNMEDQEQDTSSPDGPQQSESGANLTLRLPDQEREAEQANHDKDRVIRHIRLDDENISLDKPLQELGREIIDDLGHLPMLYLDSAQQLAAGRSYAPDLQSQEHQGQALQGALLYDEWDFRRQGFRHNWCHLLEKDIEPSGGTFISTALSEHRGVIKQLKRQFEQMRSHHRFVGRQRDGDDIDLDALTDALADRRAGLPPSERLFVRQLRDERDIAALFLVDMSSSTEGWVGKAIKESLLVMAEAMESLGDRYAIYGFSGMRRTRSEIFRVKEMNEPYNDTVQGRIASLSPKDYTRMGPPIRHFSKLLSDVEARVRLLIILTDGKPEDYDDYKGEYAIEDTRHALLEAKISGIHPFCITIDHQAQDYISHLFGEVNYLFIDDVKKLPRRMPDMYRILTT